VALIALWPYSPLAGIGALALSHALLLYPTLRPNVQWLGPVVTRFETERREVWLTIDDGPAGDTSALLALFDRHDVKATFFVKGTLSEQRPADIREMVRRGHSVANHSHTHPSATFWCLLPGRIMTEIDECNSALEKITGTRPEWFRAPVGMKNPAVHPALRRRGMRLIGWTVRGFDAVLSDPSEILQRMQPKITAGAIILMHQGREHSLRVLERLITELQSQGYAFVVPADAQLRS
jgi:peptidoglycan-N-acetylglucosamine deacetylase